MTSVVNTGIALAMIAALKGRYQMKLLMPDNMSQERRAAMRAYGGADSGHQKSREWKARDLALWRARRRQAARSVQQPGQPVAHSPPTGPEVGRPTGGSTHLSPAWVPPAPLPAYRVSAEQDKAVRSSWGCSRKREQHSGIRPGLPNICRAF